MIKETIINKMLYTDYREQTVSSIKLAGVILRHKSTSQNLEGGYDPQNYQVLLRYWLVEPYQRHLAVFSGPLIPNEDPAETLLQQCYNWSKKLGDTAGHPELKGIKGEFVCGETSEMIILTICPFFLKHYRNSGCLPIYSWRVT